MFKPRPDTPLQDITWKFQLIRGTESWRREYSGTIAPLSQHRFLLRCDRLTGRQGIKRSSRYATHLFSGGWWDGVEEIVLPPKEALRLTDEEAYLIQDIFSRWWVAAIERYCIPDVLRWNNQPLFVLL